MDKDQEEGDRVGRRCKEEKKRRKKKNSGKKHGLRTKTKGDR